LVWHKKCNKKNYSLATKNAVFLTESYTVNLIFTVQKVNCEILV
jgi:ribosomal protein L4